MRKPDQWQGRRRAARVNSMAKTNRQCGECTLCCKVFTIAELEKPAGTWCTHCAIGKGCTIYETRPKTCQIFNCSYLETAWIDEIWRPSICNMVLTADPANKRVLVRVDPDQPDAWTKEPYHAQLRRWSLEWIPSRSSIFVLLNDDVWAILPDRDEYLGRSGPKDSVGTRWIETAFGPQLQAFLVRGADSSAMTR
jgi:hypothetical protein